MDADATLTNYCYVDKASHPWMSPKQVVRVYMNNVGTSSAPGATSISDANLADAIKRALYIWNEQSGASIKLRYMGVTTSTAISNAIVVLGNSSTACTPAAAEVEYGFSFWTGDWQWSRIILYKFGNTCNFVPWVTTPSEGFDTTATDVVRVLVHEFGHAAFNMGHPDSTSSVYEECFYPSIDPVSTMGSSSRSLSNWDLEVAQQRYGVRAQYTTLRKTHMTGPTSWFTVTDAAAYSGVRPLFRMGSVGQLIESRFLAWVDNAGTGSVLRDGGAGYMYDVGRYLLGGLYEWYHLWPSLGRPVAAASQPSSQSGPPPPPVDFLVAYQKFMGTNLYEDDTGAVCWRRSNNGGATYLAETCVVATDVYGLTAAYDASTNNFLIGFARDATSLEETHQLVIVVVPATGSSTPVATTVLNATGLHAPAIACTGTVNRCLVGFETSTGYFGGVIGINPVLGSVNVYQSFQWGIRLWDTPGLAYSPIDDTFRLAQTDSNNAIFSYKAPNATLAWQGTGDIWNSPDSQISTAVLNVRNRAGVQQIGAWHLKYW